MAQNFLHGVEAVDVTTPSGPIRTVRTAIVGIVGSGTDLEDPGRRNVPVVVRGAADAAAKFGGPLGQYIQGILHRVSTIVVAVNVYDPDTHRGPYAGGEEVTLVAGTVNVANVPEDGEIDVRSQDLTTTYTVGDATMQMSWDGAALTRNGGVAGAPAADAVLNFRYRVPDPSGAGVADVAGADGANRTGVYALLDAESVTSYRPGVIGAPDYSGRTTGVAPAIAVPAAQALQTVADRIRSGFVFEAGGADATRAEATAARDVLSSRRGLAVSPWASRVVGGDIVSEPGSVQGLAAVAANDSDPARGYWFSPTGVKLPDVVGLSRPIDWGISDPNSEANLLNEQHIATFVRFGGVFRFWGDRSASQDDKWKFWAVGRVADVIAETLVREHVEFVSRPYTNDYWAAVAARVNAFLRTMRRIGALRYGRCVASDRNNETTRAAGQAIWRVEFDPSPPVERLTFELALTRDPEAAEEV